MLETSETLLPGPKTSSGPKRTLAAVTISALAMSAHSYAEGAHRDPVAHVRAGQVNSNVKSYTLDNELTRRAERADPSQTTRVVVEWQRGATLPAAFRPYARENDLTILNGSVLDLPNGLLKPLAAHANTLRIHYDYPAFKENHRTSITIGARAVQRAAGYTGSGIGIAVIDSGVVSWHDDLTNRSTALYPYGNQRVAAFVDFVNGQTTAYDDDGHGTHVAGIIAGNGYDSNGQKAGVAPDASLVVLKVLDQNGHGTVSNIIRALDWVYTNRLTYNIRVVNMSVGAGIHESYWTDPLALATKRVVDAGVVVVAAAGNTGRNGDGQPQYGGIGSPGNAPWVLTVGASSTMGTNTRDDDTMAAFSSRGPTYLDWQAKPDLVAPGVGTVSLAAPGSTLFATKAEYLLPGLVSTPNLPYLSLSGTSMAAPVVTGSVALMLQANPNLTPNAIKAILQYTAQEYLGYNPLTQGAGFLNTLGAVRLAQFYTVAKREQRVPVQSLWGRHLIWGNQMLKGGLPLPDRNAFELGTLWGAARTDRGDHIVWGTTCGDPGCDNIVWGTSDGNDNIVWGTTCSDPGCDHVVWGTSDGFDNIVWGTDCGGADCDNIVWGTVDADNIVWGTAAPGDNIVWGTGNADNIVWGTGDADNIVWGTFDAADNIVWGTENGDNIVWGTADGHDNIVWGTDVNGQPVLWDSTMNIIISWVSLPDVFGRLSDGQVFDVLSALTAPPEDLPGRDY
jgi:serine protease AprX